MTEKEYLKGLKSGAVKFRDIPKEFRTTEVYETAFLAADIDFFLIPIDKITTASLKQYVLDELEYRGLTSSILLLKRLNYPNSIVEKVQNLGDHLEEFPKYYLVFKNELISDNLEKYIVCSKCKNEFIMYNLTDLKKDITKLSAKKTFEPCINCNC